MSINLDTYEVQVREKRLGSISGYSGVVSDLASKAKDCSLTNRKRCFHENSGCMSGCAQGYLSDIVDAVIVTHGSVGCSADNMGSNNAKKWSEFSQHKPHEDIAMYNTNLTESDTVFGALDKLRDTVRSAYAERKPKAIFIASSCVSAIIGEDISSLASELREELGIPVVPVSCEGFKTKVWASGFDAAFHAILYGLVRPPEKKTNIINVINFRGSAYKELAEIFSHFDAVPLCVTGSCTVEQLSRLSEAAASVSICGTLGTYLGNGLEQKFGVPYVKELQPHGIIGFERWLRALGAVLSKEQEAEEYIAQHRAIYLPQIDALREKLRGVRAVIGMGPSYTFNFTRVLGELGIDVVFSAAWHLDQTYDHNRVPESITFLNDVQPDLPVSVSDLQHFEMVNALSKLKPDFYLYRHPSNAGLITKLGIPAISIIDEYAAFGYKGLVDFGQNILDVLANLSFEKKLAQNTKLPYSHWWLEQNQYEYLTSEVS